VTGLVFVVFAIGYGYVAYTAIATSRTLSNRVYRNQALGLAVFSLLIVEFALTATIAFSTTIVLTDIDDAIQLLGIWFAIFIGFYYYIDGSIRAARLTDPLFRDTLQWTRVRVAFWVYIIGAAIVFPIAAAFGSYNYDTGGTPAFFQAGIPLLVIVFSGLVVLPIAIRRSKDKTLKKQLSWFAVYFIWLVLLLVGSNFVPTTTAVVPLVLLLAGAYPLYRSATSLVPLYKFAREPGKSG
jgi:hypothetical protein